MESRSVLPFLSTFQVRAALFEDYYFHSGSWLHAQAVFAYEDEWVW